mgnify:CR=1 FL=1
MKTTDRTAAAIGLDVHRRFSTVTARNAEGRGRTYSYRTTPSRTTRPSRGFSRRTGLWLVPRTAVERLRRYTRAAPVRSPGYYGLCRHDTEWRNDRSSTPFAGRHTLPSTPGFPSKPDSTGIGCLFRKAACSAPTVCHRGPQVGGLLHRYRRAAWTLTISWKTP